MRRNYAENGAYSANNRKISVKLHQNISNIKEPWHLLQ